MAQQSFMSPMMFKMQLDFQRRLIKERLARESGRRKQVEEITIRLNEENNKIFQSVLAEHPELAQETTRLVVLPSGLSRLAPVGAERLRDYSQHLLETIDQATKYADIAAVPRDNHYDAYEKAAKVERRLEAIPGLRAVSDKLCTMCRGGCCASGGDHAYLSLVTIRRYMDSHPQLSRQDVLNRYLECVATETIAGACINQGSAGCTLPRELRSDICNGFYCDSLKSFQAGQVESRAVDPVLIIQRANTNWNIFEQDVCAEVVDVAVMRKGEIRHLDFAARPERAGRQSPV